MWELDDELFGRIEALEKEAEAKGRTLMRHALLAALSKPAVVSLVLGFKRIDQIEEVMKAIEG